MPVKEITVTRYETSDGREFENEEGARLHELSLPLTTFRNWYTANTLSHLDPDDFVQDVKADEMLLWLEIHLSTLRGMEVFKDDK